MNRYQFVQDAGHGWLKVSRAELDRLGLLSRISHCSYMTRSGSHIWLEVERSGVRSLNRYMA